MTGSSVVAVVLHVVEVLERMGVRYHLGGSFASTLHGVPRQTRDADIVVDLEPRHAAGLVAALAAEFYIDSAVVQDAVLHRGSFNAIHLGSGFKIDFFVKGRHQFDDLELARSVIARVTEDPPKMAAFKSAEDTILRKLQWYEAGGGVSDQQWKDVVGILKTQGDRLDLTYLGEWAARLGLGALLARARSEAT